MQGDCSSYAVHWFLPYCQKVVVLLVKTDYCEPQSLPCVAALGSPWFSPFLANAVSVSFGRIKLKPDLHAVPEMLGEAGPSSHSLPFLLKGMLSKQRLPLEMRNASLQEQDGSGKIKRSLLSYCAFFFFNFTGLLKFS